VYERSEARLSIHTGLKWLDITQGQLSRIEVGRNRVRALDNPSTTPGASFPPSFYGSTLTSMPEPPRMTGLVRLPGGPAVFAATARTEPALVESLLITFQQYATTDNLAGAHSLLPIVEQQMIFEDHLLSGSHGPLPCVSARFAEFTGWLHQDAGDLRAAMQWSNTALDFAQEAADVHLVSYTRMRKSNIAQRRP
jgi:hypothetical protein